MNGAPSPAPRRRVRWGKLLLVLAGLAAAAFAVSKLLPDRLFGSPVVADDELVVLFPTVASPSPDGKGWDVSIHGWVFEPESGDTRREAIVTPLRWMFGLRDDPERARTLERRVRRFLVDNERGKALAVTIAGRQVRLDPSRENGHLDARIQLSASTLTPAALGGRVPIRVLTGDSREMTGEVHLIPAVGLSVISDIDDTVKVSDVTNKTQLMRNTFLEEFQAVPGMADVYRGWAKEQGARFHFVSSSPWQLYEELAPFLDQAGFPPATFHLKTMRLKGTSLVELFADPLETKVATIEPLLKRFPGRRFVLVGDSGEKDPEVYGALARRYPKQIVKVFVRNVTGEKPAAERFEEAFAEVPVEKWLLFSDPAEMTLE